VPNRIIGDNKRGVDHLLQNGLAESSGRLFPVEAVRFASESRPSDLRLKDRDLLRKARLHCAQKGLFYFEHKAGENEPITKFERGIFA
jgi:hypothetical protein